MKDEDRSGEIKERDAGDEREDGTREMNEAGDRGEDETGDGKAGRRR